MLKALPSTTLAVLRPTPPSIIKSSIVRGTLPLWRSTRAWQQDLMLLALLRKKPVVLISCSNSAGCAFAYAAADGYFLNSAGVTRFTRLSVHCAERIVATSSSSGLEWFNSQCAFG